MPQNILEHNEPNPRIRSPDNQKSNSSAERAISKERLRKKILHAPSEEDNTENLSQPPPAHNIHQQQPYRPQPSSLHHGNVPFSPPSNPSRSNTFFDQALVPTKPNPNISRNSSERPSTIFVSVEPGNPVKRHDVFTIRYPNVPDMSKPRFSEPMEPASPHYRGSRHQQDFHQHSHVRYVPYRYRSRTPSPVPVRDSQSPNAPDSNRLRLEAELAVYKNLESKVKEAENQEKREKEIRKEAYQAQNRRIEDMKRAREEMKKEFELARLTAEQTAREKIETERKVEAAIRQREEEQAVRMEREIRMKLEAERQAEEAEKMAKQKREDDLEELIHMKVMEKLDGFIEIAKQRLGTPETLVLGTGHRPQINQEKTSGDQSPKDRARQPQRVSRARASSCHPSITRPSSRRPFTDKDAAPPGDMKWDENPMPVPEPPSFIPGVEAQHDTEGYQPAREFRPRFYGSLGGQSRGRPEAQSDTSFGNIWQRSPISDGSSHTDIPQEFVDRIANAVAGIMRENSHQRTSIPLCMYNEHRPTFSQPLQEDWVAPGPLTSPEPVRTSVGEKPEAALMEASQTAPIFPISRSDFEGRERLPYSTFVSRTGMPSLNRVTVSQPTLTQSRKAKHGTEGEMRDGENAKFLKPHNLKAPGPQVEGLDLRMGSSMTSQHMAGTRGNVASDESLTWVNSDVSANGGRNFQGLIRPQSAHTQQPQEDKDQGRLSTLEREYLTLALRRILG
ncbi:hypothetical protein FCOIX_13670 [Fusarium coicis]|nr:hypothetical protein FCOIX_13670 [Fusarium coicis]